MNVTYKLRPGLCSGLTWGGDELPADGWLRFPIGLAHQGDVGAFIHHKVFGEVDDFWWYWWNRNKGRKRRKGQFNEGINPYWSSEQSFWWHLDIIWLDWSTRCVCKSQIPRSPENSTFRPSCFLLNLAVHCTFHVLLKRIETKRPSVGLRGWNWTPGWGVGRGHAHHCDIIKGCFQRI